MYLVRVVDTDIRIFFKKVPITYAIIPIAKLLYFKVWFRLFLRIFRGFAHTLYVRTYIWTKTYRFAKISSILLAIFMLYFVQVRIIFKVHERSRVHKLFELYHT